MCIVILYTYLLNYINIYEDQAWKKLFINISGKQKVKVTSLWFHLWKNMNTLDTNWKEILVLER